MKRHVIHPVGPFSLAHSAAFIAGFSPATGTSVSFDDTSPAVRAAFRSTATGARSACGSPRPEVPTRRWSPYQAAVWSVLSQRTSMGNAA